MENRLYLGDNLEVMRESLEDASVDLIYLDPPFNSGNDYRVIERDVTHSIAPVVKKAFSDCWHWEEWEREYRESLSSCADNVRRLMRGLREILGASPMLAYLTMMTIRLIEMRRVLMPTGSIYLHCDGSAGHHLRTVMEAVFGGENYRNTIIWQRFNFHANAKRWGRIHDRILYFAASSKADKRFNTQRSHYKESYIKSHFKRDSEGRLFRLDNALAAGEGPPMKFFGREIAPPPGSRWRWKQETIDNLCEKGVIVLTSRGRPAVKRYLDQMPGHPIGDVWNDIPPVNPMAKERLGYDTQKPLALLERIIKASSREGETVFDPFCGSGTTLEAAQRLGRLWIGIDSSEEAVKITAERLRRIEGCCFRVVENGE